QGFLGGGEPRLRRFGGCEAALEFLRIGSRALVECLERSLSADDLLLRSREIPRVLRLGLRGRLDCFLVGRQLIRGFVHRLLSAVQFASPLREAGLGRLQGGFFRGHVFRSGVQDRLASLQVCFRTTQLRLFRAKFRFPQAELLSFDSTAATRRRASTACVFSVKSERIASTAFRSDPSALRPRSSSAFDSRNSSRSAAKPDSFFSRSARAAACASSRRSRSMDRDSNFAIAVLWASRAERNSFS